MDNAMALSAGQSCLQVAFETTAALAQTPGLPVPVWLQIHGSEGVTQPLKFDPTEEGGVAVYDRTAEACGNLTQLTVWLEPYMVGSLASMHQVIPFIPAKTCRSLCIAARLLTISPDCVL